MGGGERGKQREGEKEEREGNGETCNEERGRGREREREGRGEGRIEKEGRKGGEKREAEKVISEVTIPADSWRRFDIKSGQPVTCET